MKILKMGIKLKFYETQNIDQGDVRLNEGLTVQINNQDLLLMKIEFQQNPVKMRSPVIICMGF